jgi:hypothetical protein
MVRTKLHQLLRCYRIGYQADQWLQACWGVGIKRDFNDAIRIQAETFVAGQRFARKLENDPLVHAFEYRMPRMNRRIAQLRLSVRGAAPRVDNRDAQPLKVPRVACD